VQCGAKETKYLWCIVVHAMTQTHERPPSEWEHSHAVKEGDVLVQGRDWGEWEVTTVEDNGNVRVRRVDEDRRDADERDTWTEEAVRHALASGNMTRKSDDLSHALATF